MCTHQEYIETVANIALNRLPAEQRDKVRAHLTYGYGQPGLRGVTYFGRWDAGDGSDPIPFVEICASGEENDIQLAGTTIHELAHVLAGYEAGHGKEWRKACELLGLRRAKAAGNIYKLAQFAPDVRMQVATLKSPTDGKPVGAHHTLTGRVVMPKPCPMGIGTRGGKSRGVGSGSRLRKWQCACEPKPVIVRVASDNFRATCDVCGSPFQRAA